MKKNIIFRTVYSFLIAKVVKNITFSFKLQNQVRDIRQG